MFYVCAYLVVSFMKNAIELIGTLCLLCIKTKQDWKLHCLLKNDIKDRNN